MLLALGALEPTIYAWVHDGTWVKLLPDRALVACYSHFDDGTNHSKLFWELWDRLEQRSLKDAAISQLLSRCATGDSNALPGTLEWENKYGMPLVKYWRSYPERADLESVVSHLPSRITVDVPSNPTNAQIPTGIRTWAIVQVQQYKRRSIAEWQPALRVQAQLPGAEEIIRSARGCIYVPIPPLNPGKHEVPFDVELGSIQNDGSFSALEHQQVSVAVDVVENKASDTWVDNPAIGELLKSMAKIKIEPSDDDARVLSFTYRPGPIKSSPLLSNVRLKFAIEVIHAGKVVARSFYLNPDREMILSDNSQVHDGAWSIRIRDEAWTPGDRISDGARTSDPYWRGQIEWPLIR